MQLKKRYFLIILPLLVLAGCAKYNSRPLNKLINEIPEKKENTSFVSLQYKVLTKKECTQYFDRNIISKGYQPIQISLLNCSTRSFDLSLNNFSLPCATPNEVAQKLHTNTAGRATGYAFAGLIIPLFFIPAIVDGVGSSKANKQLDDDFYEKGLRNQVIRPQNTVNGIVFVPRTDFHENFELTLIDLESKEKLTLSPVKNQVNA